ncbi:Methyltransferase domain-containing protein [Arenibacter nanhaiticus]|uniref:Methyltransferase domain-containing protein n=1 Tax=Arenibacter nanhaiticus TaxID=558155 RepID=A0A1M6FL89_9FLAO|nr:class I SAM-dependent methyltransferase [Arenibacter nanhaiticus]SHI98471.1 Methyltransferase domain-containing protein [Arenibacter nanhaiticus]
MTQAEIFDRHVEEYEKWYDDHSQVYESELLAIREQLSKLPENIKGIEVGLGTGRFSVPLGIKEGVEPSRAMAQKAIKRGVEVMEGTAERLKYGDLQFDFVLFVTICHLNDIKDALSEAYRVLKHQGVVLIGFLDKERSIATQYIEKRKQSTFYAKANFYTVARIQTLLKEARFKDLEFTQTLFGDLEDIENVQMPKPGHGEGSFVVVKATKK